MDRVETVRDEVGKCDNHRDGGELELAGLLTLAEASRLVPTVARRGMHPRTLARWITRGVLAPGAPRRTKMRAVRVGRSYFTTGEWLREFLVKVGAVETSG